MKKTSFKDLIRSDLNRYIQTYALRGQKFSKVRVALESFLFKSGFKAVFLYRVSHWFFQKHLTYIAWFFTRLNVILNGAEIEFNARIGPGMFIAHPVGIVIGRGTVIGSGVTLFQGVSFGVKSWRPDEINNFPKVGDNCYFFAHSAILGGITIGSNCVIAANAVLKKDMPDGSMAAGIPAEVREGKGKDMIGSWSTIKKKKAAL